MIKNFAIALTVQFLAIFLFQYNNISAQEKSANNWIRVGSNNAEFSIEVPEGYKYFYDENGFWVSKDSRNYSLKKMSMLNAYIENSLLSFESYETGKDGLQAVYETDKWFSKYHDSAEISSFERNAVKFKQIVTNDGNGYCISQYFFSKSRIYILTAASKNGENTTIKRFLDSLLFNPDTRVVADSDFVPFSSLKITSTNLTEIKDEDEETEIPSKKKTSKSKEKSYDPSKIFIAKKLSPSYIDSARNKGIKGSIKLRLKFSKDAFISDIEILKSLPEGLLRQAIFAALRIKFLPQEENGKSVSVMKTVTYNFDIY